MKARSHKEVILLPQGGMAERSCCPAFPLPFDGLIVTRQIDFSDEVPDQFNLLPAVAAGLVRRMDADPFVSFPAPPYFGQRPEVTGQPLRLQGGRLFHQGHIFPHHAGSFPFGGAASS